MNDRPFQIRQVPVVTSFIASQEPGTQFRVSVHSWSKPEAGAVLKAKVVEGNLAAWEVRVFVDGEMVG